jgi:hypothetical protein
MVPVENDALGSLLVRLTVPLKAVSTVPLALYAVTVKVSGVPAVTVLGTPVTVKYGEDTLTVAVPRIELLLVDVAVTVWEPAVSSVTVNAWEPSSADVNVYDEGSMAEPSLLVKLTVPV